MLLQVVQKKTIFKVHHSIVQKKKFTIVKIQ